MTEKAKASNASNAKSGEKTKYYIYQLREHSREIFGVRPEVLDGALFNYKETQITKGEAKKLIDNFLKREVK